MSGRLWAAWITLAAAQGLVSPATADADKAGNVITYVCRVDTAFTTAEGETLIGTSCIDGKYRCNDVAGRGYCAPGTTQKGVTRRCSWVALSMCRSQ
jgi:hypothetical protein